MFGTSHSILSRIRSRFTSTTCAGRSTTNIPPSLSILAGAKDIFSGRAIKGVRQEFVFKHLLSPLSLWERAGVRAWRWNPTHSFSSYPSGLQSQRRRFFLFPVAELRPHPTLSKGRGQFT